MPTIRNSKGEEFEVSDVDAVNMHAADPSLQIVGDVAVSPGESGQAPVLVTAGQATSQEGVTPATAAEKGAYQHRQYLDDKTSVVGAAARGAVRGVPLLGTVAEQYMDPDTLEADETIHPIATVGGKLAGAIASSEVTGLGSVGDVVSEALGGGLLARAAGEAAVGSIYGLDNATHELANSTSPLTAERVASVLSSNMLLGGAIGGAFGAGSKLVERGLQAAGEKIANAVGTRAALDGLPAELQGLDDAGLREAMTGAKAEHAADIAAERKSMEQLRVEQRAELANQVRDFHAELATERPIFHAVTGEDIKAAVPGIGTEVSSPLNKSYRALRAAFDNPIAVAENPTSLLKPLQMQQTALENLQGRMPELQQALAGDARAAALEHVDYALEQNKRFQDAIRQLDKSTPITGTRLTSLESGPSQKMLAIEQAREALKQAPEMGLLAKGATTGAFAGATALAHMIPGVGITAPFLGKAAADMVGRTFERLAGADAAVVSRSAETVKRFLGTGEKGLERAAPFARTTASQVLSSVRFGPGPGAKSDKLHDLFAARSAELRQQTMYAPDGSVQVRPEVRKAIEAKLAPISAVNPVLAGYIETVKSRGLAYISSKMPRQPDIGGIQIGPDKWRPSHLEMRQWARVIRTVEDPASVEDRLEQGMMTNDEADAYRAVFPERFAQLQQTIFAALPTLSKTLPMKKKIALSIFTGVPLIPALQPNVLAVLQGNYAAEPGSAGGTQAPAAQPNFGAFGSLKSADKPTPSQAREQGE